MPNYGTDSRFKNAFDSWEHEVFEYIAKFHPNATDDLTGQANRKFFFLTITISVGFAGQSSRISLKQSR